jgi:phosphoglycerate dehydrogenase-like enzyme
VASETSGIDRFWHVDLRRFHDTLPPAPLDVLVVEPIPAEVMNWLAARQAVRLAPGLASDPLALRAALSQTRAVIAPPSATLDASALRQAPHLRAVGRVSAGVENLDLDACARSGIEVVRASAASAAAEAEFVIGALLALLRRVPILNDEGLLVGRELGACTVGIVGATPATAQLAGLLQGFGAQVLGYDPGIHADDPSWAQAGMRGSGLHELVRDSDALCVLLTHYTRFSGLFGQRLLSEAKPHQVVVNLGHSTLFDEAALAHALREGPLAACWFDSLEPGAQDPGRPLRHLDTLQVTPRVASTTRESRLRSAWVVAQRIDTILRAAPVRRRFRPAAPGGNAGPGGVPEPV